MKIGPVKIAVSLAMFTCRHCGDEYNNRLKHTCVMTVGQLGVPHAMRKPRAKNNSKGR